MQVAERTTDVDKVDRVGYCTRVQMGARRAVSEALVFHTESRPKKLANRESQMEKSHLLSTKSQNSGDG